MVLLINIGLLIGPTHSIGSFYQEPGSGVGRLTVLEHLVVAEDKELLARVLLLYVRQEAVNLVVLQTQVVALGLTQQLQVMMFADMYTVASCGIINIFKEKI